MYGKTVRLTVEYLVNADGHTSHLSTGNAETAYWIVDEAGDIHAYKRNVATQNHSYYQTIHTPLPQRPLCQHQTHRTHPQEEHPHLEMDALDTIHETHAPVHTTTHQREQAVPTSLDLSGTPSPGHDAPTPTPAQDPNDYLTGHG